MSDFTPERATNDGFSLSGVDNRTTAATTEQHLRRHEDNVPFLPFHRRCYARVCAMPTILTHPAIPLALGLGLGKSVISRRLLYTGMIASIVPDADVIGVALGVPWGDPLAHRGFTHSLTLAFALAGLGAILHRALQTRALVAFLFLFGATASHGVLDAFTTGGSGIAFLWPWSNERYFAPAQVIAVSPIGISRFFSERGVRVLTSELLWVWLPCLMMLTTLRLVRRNQSC